MDAATKTNPGNFFEDFTLGQRIDHATPRTVTAGDRALYGALYPTRFALPSSDEFAAACGLSPAPVEELPDVIVPRTLERDSELLRGAGLEPLDRKGMVFAPLSWRWSLSDRDLSVNYVTASIRPRSGG